MKRLKIRGVATIAGALCLTLIVACGPGAQQTTSDTQGQTERAAGGTTERSGAEVAKERGGKLIMSQSTGFGNPNDPHLTATGNGRTYAIPVANWLLKRDVHDKKFPIIPDLAKSWELSNDGLTYTFKLREGVKFQNVAPVNGREFTSEDAKYNLMRITTADSSIVVDKWKPRFQRALDFGTIKSVDTPDKYTLVVKLAEPYAPFIDAVANPGTAMLPREFVEKFPEKIITEGMVGTGPFMPVEYKNQQLATYKKNPDYWNKDSAGGQLPYLDELHFLYFADVQSEIAAFRSSQLDIPRGLKKSQVDTLKRENPNFQVFVTPSATLAMFRFNMKFKPFQDVKVRRAIHLAVDRHQIVDLVTEGTGVVSGPVTPIYADMANTMDWLLSQPGYRKDKPQDIEEAKRLMKEAGYADGLAFEVLSSTNIDPGDLLAVFADQLKPLNITLKATIVDYAGQWVPRSTQGEFELTHMTHALATDADSLLSPHLISDAPRNYGKFSDPTLDDMIKKERSATTQEERKKWAQEAEKRALEIVPIAPLYTTTNTILVQPWVHNAGDGPVAGASAYITERAWVSKH